MTIGRPFWRSHNSGYHGGCQLTTQCFYVLLSTYLRAIWLAVTIDIDFSLQNEFVCDTSAGEIKGFIPGQETAAATATATEAAATTALERRVTQINGGQFSWG